MLFERIVEKIVFKCIITISKKLEKYVLKRKQHKQIICQFRITATASADVDNLIHKYKLIYIYIYTYIQYICNTPTIYMYINICLYTRSLNPSVT